MKRLCVCVCDIMVWRKVVLYSFMLLCIIIFVLHRLHENQNSGEIVTIVVISDLSERVLDVITLLCYKLLFVFFYHL